MKKLTVDELKSLTTPDVFKFIRKTLAFDSSIIKSFRYSEPDWEQEHLRFEMSGYDEDSSPGERTLYNLKLLNLFAYLGIYDYTHYLVLDFYKGSGTIYLKYFNEDRTVEIDVSGYGTVDIIYEVFKLTIFSGKDARRRTE